MNNTKKKIILKKKPTLFEKKTDKVLKKFNKENQLPTKKLGKESPPIDEMIIIHRSNRYNNKRTLIETCELKNESGYKFLKIWELYEPKEPSSVQWIHSKKGLLIPITDAKRWIKRLYEYYYPNH